MGGVRRGVVLLKLLAYVLELEHTATRSLGILLPCSGARLS